MRAQPLQPPRGCRLTPGSAGNCSVDNSTALDVVLVAQDLNQPAPNLQSRPTILALDPEQAPEDAGLGLQRLHPTFTASGALAVGDLLGGPNASRWAASRCKDVLCCEELPAVPEPDVDSAGCWVSMVSSMCRWCHAWAWAGAVLAGTAAACLRAEEVVCIWGLRSSCPPVALKPQPVLPGSGGWQHPSCRWLVGDRLLAAPAALAVQASLPAHALLLLMARSTQPAHAQAATHVCSRTLRALLPRGSTLGQSWAPRTSNYPQQVKPARPVRLSALLDLTRLLLVQLPAGHGLHCPPLSRSAASQPVRGSAPSHAGGTQPDLPAHPPGAHGCVPAYRHSVRPARGAKLPPGER